jgi:hypothetical protein
MKIKLTCNWCDDNTLYNRFQRVYVNSLNERTDHSFTSDSDFDLLVVINGSNEHLNVPKNKTLGVMMEPSWACHFRQHLEYRSAHILYHTQPTSSQYIYYPGLLPPHIDYKDGYDLNYYINTTFKKTKKCSIITSYNSQLASTQSIYHKRVNFVKKILETDLDVDIYGNSWEESGIHDQRIKGTLANKKGGLIDYEYSIAIENCIERDYFSEKLTDCILADVTPIYYGCPGIDRFFDNCYTLSTLDDITELRGILANTHTQSQSRNKQLIATKYNLYTAIVKYIDSGIL